MAYPHIGPKPDAPVIPPCLTLQPALVEWLTALPIRHRAAYVHRAQMLVESGADSPAAMGAILRMLVAERRLAHWAIRAERYRHRNIAQHKAALKEGTIAEKDIARALAIYEAERERESAPAVRPASGQALGVRGLI